MRSEPISEMEIQHTGETAQKLALICIGVITALVGIAALAVWLISEEIGRML